MGRTSGLWDLLSQALNGATTFLLTVLVARSATIEEFGRFSLVMLAYVILAGVTRASVGQCLLIDERAADGAGATTTYLIAGAIAGASALLVSLIVGAAHIGVLFLICLPIAGLHDSHRYVLFATQRSRAAFVPDAVWVGVFLLAAALYAALHSTTAAALVSLWGFGGFVALLPGLVWVGRPGGGHSAGRWVREHMVSLRPLLSEGIALIGAGALGMIALATASSVADAGQFRAGQLILAPIGTVVLAAQVTALRRLAPARAELAEARRVAGGVVLRTTIAALAWTAVVALTPDRVGTELMGASWHAAQEILTPMAVAVVLSTISTIGFAFIKAIWSAQHAWVLRLRIVWIEPVLVLVGSLLDGAPGAAWGLVVGHALVLAWVARRLRQLGREQSAEALEA